MSEDGVLAAVAVFLIGAYGIGVAVWSRARRARRRKALAETTDYYGQM